MPGQITASVHATCGAMPCCAVPCRQAARCSNRRQQQSSPSQVVAAAVEDDAVWVVQPAVWRRDVEARAVDSGLGRQIRCRSNGQRHWQRQQLGVAAAPGGGGRDGAGRQSAAFSTYRRVERLVCSRSWAKGARWRPLLIAASDPAGSASYGWRLEAHHNTQSFPRTADQAEERARTHAALAPRGSARLAP